MYTIYDLHLSPYEIGRQFSRHHRYFILKDDLIHRGYGNSLEEATDDIRAVTYFLGNKYIDILERLYIIAEVDNLDDLKFLYPEHYI